MRKRLKSSQPGRFNAASLLKKTALGTLIGATVLGTLPATIGISQAAPEKVTAPLVTQGGWQPGLKKIEISIRDANGNYPNFERTRGLIAQTALVGSSGEPANIFVFSDTDKNQVVLGAVQNNMSQTFTAFPSLTNQDQHAVTVNDLFMESFKSPESLPNLYGTGQDTGSGTSNVYRLVMEKNEMSASPLLGPEVLADPKGIDQQPGSETLYVAGGKDGKVWKLIPNPAYVVDTTDHIEGGLSGGNPVETVDNDGDPVETVDNDGEQTVPGIAPNEGNEVKEVNPTEGTTEIEGTESGSRTFAPLSAPNSDATTQGALATPYMATVVADFDDVHSNLTDVAYDNGDLYVSDAGLNQIVRIDLDQAGKTTVVDAGLNEPQSIALDNEHNLYIADTENHQVKKLNTATGQVEVVAGTGEASQSYEGVPAVQSSLTEPTSVAVDKTTGALYIADLGRIQKLENQFFYKQVQEEGRVWNLIENVAGLDHVRDDMERIQNRKNYRLATDISKSQLEEYYASQDRPNTWVPIGGGEIGFSGTFDGAGHVIDGLEVKNLDDDNRYAGLFGATYKATIQNLRLTNVKMNAYRQSGGLTALDYSSNIRKVAVEGTVSGNRYVGGLIGESRGTTIDQAYFDGKVSGTGSIGGLLGYAAMDGYNIVSNSYAWAQMMLTPEYLQRNLDTGAAGGFVGTVSYEASPEEGTGAFQHNYSSASIMTAIIEDRNLQANETVVESKIGPFEGWVFSEIEVPHASNYWDSGAYGATGTSKLASAFTAEEMKVQANFAEWDFANVWSMDPIRQNYPILKVFLKETTPPPVTEPTPPVTEPTVPTIPSTPSFEPSTPIVTAPTPTPSNTTTINVNVQNDKTTNGSVVSTLAITRTKGTDGTTKDALQLTPAKAAEIINLLKTSGSKTAAIVLPDTNDEVSQWDLTVPNAASKVLTAEGVELVILNPNVRITVPASSLTNLTDDLYFRLIPVKSTSTSAEIQARALATPEIVATANGGSITVLGRPMTIETNLQSRPVTLTLPLPAGSTFTAAQQRKLGVYIEHSDGTKQLVPGKVVTGEDGKPGLELTVNHFSTFTIVNVSSWGGTLNAAPYILGYQNGSFKPEQDITRAELAAIVGRITGMTTGTAAFSDVKNGSWASTVAGPAAASGIMTGYSDGTFKPNSSITRAELAAALAKLLPQSGLNTSAAAAGFRDLAAGHWATEAAEQLQAAGVITGYADGSFKPEQAITRAEAVTMINRLIGLDASTTQPGAGEWTDVASAYWAHDAILAASMKR
ncbi:MULTISPECIES: S-layer homology domain-containing protein [Saccharibacillus]|uniref:S-layer homology domain-containing protein n=1 Tax=Saccharibacillus TaxID=456492 RepID=UPI001239A034|nr:S-layer homology domain-containing protein [Saccharibacillus sp. WB 17]MWJ31281.1 hypothetical protein [Saccharibacillus sp. WB 17]